MRGQRVQLIDKVYILCKKCPFRFSWPNTFVCMCVVVVGAVCVVVVQM